MPLLPPLFPFLLQVRPTDGYVEIQPMPYPWVWGEEGYPVLASRQDGSDGIRTRGLSLDRGAWWTDEGASAPGVPGRVCLRQ